MLLPLAQTLIEDTVVPNFNYWVYVVLMMIGLYAMIAKNNFIKKLIGMCIFQTAIILFFVSIGVKGEDTTIPILLDDDKAAIYAAEGDAKYTAIEPDQYANPLLHVLMLTAIVVGVSTLGLALAIAQRVYRDYGTLEEDEILEQVNPGKNG